jgi:hypothetical protein
VISAAFIGAAHFQAQRIHVHRDHFVQHREDQRAAIHDHFLAAKASPYEGDFLRRAAVEPREDQADGQQGDENDACNDEDVIESECHESGLLKRVVNGEGR